MDDRCRFVYGGPARGGGRKGQECGRPERDHCPAAMGHERGSDHADECRLSGVSFLRTRYDAPSRAMVHHPFHRRRGQVAG